MFTSMLTPTLACNWWKVCLALIAVYVLNRVYSRIIRQQKHRQLAKSMGCRDIPRLRARDPIYGLDLVYKGYQAFMTHTLLEKNNQDFVTLNTNTYFFSVMGLDVVSTLEPQNLKCVLSTSFKDFELSKEREVSLGDILGEGIFITNGPKWKHSRELLRPNFERAQIDDASMFDKHANNLIAAIPKNGEPVDLQPLFFSASLDIATEFLFDRSTDCLKSRKEKSRAVSDVDGFVEAFGYIIDSVVGTNSKWGFLGMFLPDFQRKKKVEVLHCFVDTIVAEAIKDRDSSLSKEEEETSKGRYIFLHELISSTQDPLKIRAELLNILLAGRDTTASLLSNILFTLSQSPAIFTKLEEEILNSFPDNDHNPTFSELKALPYLRALINEAQRLYPIVPENDRQAVRDTSIPCGGGPDGKSAVFIPKGTIVHWSLWGMHRRRDLYGPDAEEFRPERWLDDPDTGKRGLRVGWEFLPFNGGPRTCIGQQFALMETSYLVVKIVRAFERIDPIEGEKGRVWREKFGLTCTVDGGVKVVMMPRKGKEGE